MTATAAALKPSYDWAHPEEWLDVPCEHGGKSYRRMAVEDRAMLEDRVRTGCDAFAATALLAVPPPIGHAGGTLFQAADFARVRLESFGPFRKTWRPAPGITPMTAVELLAALDRGDWTAITAQGYSFLDEYRQEVVCTRCGGAGHCNICGEAGTETMPIDAALLAEYLEKLHHAAGCVCARCAKDGNPRPRPGCICCDPIAGGLAAAFGDLPPDPLAIKLEPETAKLEPEAASGGSDEPVSLDDFGSAPSVPMMTAHSGSTSPDPTGRAPVSPPAADPATDLVVSLDQDVVPLGAPAPAAKPKRQRAKKAAAPLDPRALDLAPNEGTAGEAAARHDLDAAREAEVERGLDDAVWMIEGAEDAAFIKAVNDGLSPEVAAARAAQVRENCILDLLERGLVIDSPVAAEWAARRKHEMEAEADEIEQRLAALARRAKKQKALAERLLGPKLEAWARKQPLDGKSIALPRGGRLTFFETQERYVVDDERAVREAVLGQMGEQAAVDAGIVKKRFDLMLTGLKAHGLASKKAWPGAKIVPGDARGSLRYYPRG